MEKTLKIALKNKYGLHVRPSTAIVKLTGKYHAKITVGVEGGEPVDAGNIMMLMTLGAPQGTVLEFHADGDDAEEAIAEIQELVEGRFGGIE